MGTPALAVLDTSVLIAEEHGRPLGGPVPERAAISVVTLAELRFGVLMAPDPAAHARRLRTFSAVERYYEPLPITVEIASAFADLMAEARQRGHRPQAMDVWIAATAVAHDLPLYTQDSDFDDLRGVTVVRL